MHGDNTFSFNIMAGQNVFMIGVLSKAYQRTSIASESILRGAQQPKIGADELQKCGLGQGDLNVF